jgi:hypothetical protein
MCGVRLKAAVLADPFCHEAFAILIDGHMLTSRDEQILVSSIVFPPEDRWLELMYRVTSKKVCCCVWSERCLNPCRGGLLD